MEHDKQRFIANFDQFLHGWRLHSAQRHAKRHPDDDHADDVGLVAERAEQTLGHVLQEDFRGGQCFPCFFGRRGPFETRPRAGPQNIRHEHADHDGNRRVQQQQANEAAGRSARDFRGHEHMDHGHQDQRRGERTQQLQNQFAGNIEYVRTFTEQHTGEHSEDQSDDNANVKRNRSPSIKPTCGLRFRFRLRHRQFSSGDARAY